MMNTPGPDKPDPPEPTVAEIAANIHKAEREIRDTMVPYTTPDRQLEWLQERGLCLHIEDIPRHMHDGIIRFVLRGVPPGGFAMSVLGNDLSGAIQRADRINIHHLKAWVSFVHNDLPANSCGNPEKVTHWIQQGGLLGIEGREGESS
jgi:hypothetical protein